MPLSNRRVLEVMDALLSAADSSARARLVAVAVVETIAESACVVHRLFAREGGPALLPVGLAGAVTIGDEALSAGSGLGAALFAGRGETVGHSGSEAAREEYAHVHVSRSIVSLAYVPFFQAKTLVGVIEVLAFAEPIGVAELEALREVAGLAGPAILSAEEGERQRQDLLDSVHRMSQLYDVEKSLNATVELDAVMAMAPAKAAAMLECQAMHLWLFDGDELRLMAAHGEDATVEPGAVQLPEEGYVAAMAEEGEPLLIADAGDERLGRRNAVLASMAEEQRTEPVTNALVVPLMQDESEIGVLEAVNRAGGRAFDEDDQFFLSAMAETVSNALKNASLMHAERKLEILEALVHVSSEITSTLRLDRLLQIIVNSPQSVLPCERCSIALDNRGRLQLKAVSGMANIPAGDLQLEHLRELLQWLSTYDRQLLIRQHEQEPETEDAQVRTAIGKHFESSGYRALFALPLADDQGRVGLLLYESSDPEFLEVAHIEMIKVLAGQTTGAIRNALLYREVPLISPLEPLVQRKQAFMRSDGKRQGVILGTAAIVILLLIFCPLPLRVGGDAVVAPQSVVTLAAPVEGTIAHVYARAIS